MHVIFFFQDTCLMVDNVLGKQICCFWSTNNY